METTGIGAAAGAEKGCATQGIGQARRPEISRAEAGQKGGAIMNDGYISKIILTAMVFALGVVLRHFAGVPEMAWYQHAADAGPLCIAWSIWSGGRKK